MTSAEFSVTVEGESLLVKVVGELDLATAPELDACLRPVRGDVAIDCSGLDFIDSSGIRSLVEAHRAAEARGDRLTIRNLPENARRALEAVGLISILRIE
jgi:anti-sigma B factor antagonist